MSKRNDRISRRIFLAGSATSIAAAGLLGVSKRINASPQETGSILPSTKKMIYRKLGNTGIEIPVVNMGVMNTLDAELVKKSYELGARYFDTAAWYMRGKNEETVGRVIKELNVRDKVIIGTKIYIPNQQRPTLTAKEAKEQYLKIANESLKRLQTDHVDILYSHNVPDLQWLNNPGIIEALQELKDQKKTRAIGFTTHLNMLECIRDATKSGVYDVIETAFNYSYHDWKEYIDTIKAAADKGIGIVAMKTQCKQQWYMDAMPDSLKAFYKGEILHTALLKWVLLHDFICCAIPGYTTFKEMEENLAVAYDLELTPEEKEFLKNRNIVNAMSAVCRQCAQCRTTCPKGVDVPELIRTHMYAASYTNFAQAKDTIMEIPGHKGLKNCLSCNSCKARCARNVNIARRIDELKMIYA